MIPADARRAVEKRSSGNCERCGGLAVDIHHRRPRGAGGSRNPAINQPPNLVALCRRCHSWAEKHRLDAEGSGWLVPRRSALTPAETPIYREGRWWFLSDSWTPAGNALEVPF